MALAYPEPEKGGRGKKRSGSGTFPDVTFQRLAEARSVLEHEDLVGQVIAGAIRLDAARTEADKRRWKYLKDVDAADVSHRAKLPYCRGSRQGHQAFGRDRLAACKLRPASL